MVNELLRPHSPNIEGGERLEVRGNVLFLTKDPTLIGAQLAGRKLRNVPRSDLLDDISTDEIIPNSACLSYSGEKGYLGRNLFSGIRDESIKEGDLIKGNFQVLVAGSSFAKGSSRIHAPLALKEAGINVIIADAERIFSENSASCGIYIISPESDLAEKILGEQSVLVSEILSDMSPMTQEVMKRGGLLSFLRDYEHGEVSLPENNTRKRDMTMAEKIIAQKVLKDREAFVSPGEEYIVEPDQYYGYELQSPAVISALNNEFGEAIIARKAEKITLHNDHTALLNDDNSKRQRENQSRFAHSLGITVYEADEKRGAPAICHTKMLEDHALPGQLILGNDSHTSTLGVLNSLAIGKGAIDFAGAIAFDKMALTVPETIRVNLKGRLRPGVTMKDFMLQFGAHPELKEARIGSGRIFEYGGSGLDEVTFDEQIKLSNMSVEHLGVSGIVEPNRQTVRYLREKRGLTEKEILERLVFSDEEAEYFRVFNIDLNDVEHTVAEPGNTQNGKPLSEIREQHVMIDKAYIGSCTHGTNEDLRQAAEILQGKKIADGVKLFFQSSSEVNQDESEKLGYTKIIVEAGGIPLPIGCGACMNAGPGSTEEGETGLFATNRNFPRRTGKGKTYLASVPVVAASAVNGYICGPEDLPPLET